MTYKSYRAYTGQNGYNVADLVDNILSGINERDEKIVSITPIMEGYWVLIITQVEPTYG